MKEEKKELNNQLWQARKRLGLQRKQVAFLLQCKSNDQISRYERGRHFPSLRTAFKLEIIYQMPVRLLFQGLFEKCQAEIHEAGKYLSNDFLSMPQIKDYTEQLTLEEFCFYANLLKNHVPSTFELREIDKHVINLSHVSSDHRRDFGELRTN